MTFKTIESTPRSSKILHDVEAVYMPQGAFTLPNVNLKHQTNAITTGINLASIYATGGAAGNRAWMGSYAEVESNTPTLLVDTIAHSGSDEGSKGIITHICGPITAAGSTNPITTIIVERPGYDTLTYNYVSSAENILLIGGFIPGLRGHTASNSNYYNAQFLGNRDDSGAYSSIALVLTPPQAYAKGMGIPYTKGAKVYCFTDTKHATAGYNRAAVTYINTGEINL